MARITIRSSRNRFAVRLNSSVRPHTVILPLPKLAKPIHALLAVRSRARFVACAIPHNLAAQLGSSQIDSAYKAGAWPLAGWEETARMEAGNHHVQLRKELLRSGLTAVALSLLALIVAALFGKLDPSLPVDYGKLLTAFGSAVATWGAFFQLGAPSKTYRGNLLHEVAHTSIFALLLVFGIVLAAVGSLWWQ